MKVISVHLAILLLFSAQAFAADDLQDLVLLKKGSENAFAWSLSQLPSEREHLDLILVIKNTGAKWIDLKGVDASHVELVSSAGKRLKIWRATGLDGIAHGEIVIGHIYVQGPWSDQVTYSLRLKPRKGAFEPVALQADGLTFKIPAKRKGIEVDDSKREKSTGIQSFGQIPNDVTIIKTFKYSETQMLRDLQAIGINVEGITKGRLKSGEDFVGGMTVVAKNLHGTADAPFSRSAFTLNDPLGIRITFDEPKALVAMTLIGPTTNTDAKLKLVFYDVDGKELATENADTRHVKNDGFDSRGAVFRGLSTEQANIKSVALVPTELSEKQRIVIAGIDYLCLSDKPIETGKPKNLDSLVAKLSSDEFSVRRNAEEELVSLGPAVLRFLPDPANEKDAETKFRLESVVTRITKSRSNPTPNGNID